MGQKVMHTYSSLIVNSGPLYFQEVLQAWQLQETQYFSLTLEPCHSISIWSLYQGHNVTLSQFCTCSYSWWHTTAPGVLWPVSCLSLASLSHTLTSLLLVPLFMLWSIDHYVFLSRTTTTAPIASRHILASSTRAVAIASHNTLTLPLTCFMWAWGLAKNLIKRPPTYLSPSFAGLPC